MSVSTPAILFIGKVGVCRSEATATCVNHPKTVSHGAQITTFQKFFARFPIFVFSLLKKSDNPRRAYSWLILRWDDWVENDRLRKLNDENREIAQALKRQYLESTQKTAKPTASHKRKGLPSDLGSTRGSEERHASASATGRGQKRGRNADLEEVRDEVVLDFVDVTLGGRT